MSRASSGSAPQAPEHRLSSLCGQRAFCPLNGKGEVLHQLGEVFAPPHFRQAKSLPTAQAGKPVFRALAHLRAFTLVEVLVAMTFLGILVPVIVSALSVATRASVSAERTTLAAQLAENKLSELL